MFNELAGLIYDAFVDSFARVKNVLISLQLNSMQLKNLDNGLDDALASFKEKLDSIYSDYMNEDNDKDENDLLNGDN